MQKLLSVARAVISMWAISTWTLLAVPSFAALVVNPPQPITQRVTVQPIIVSDTGGGNTAEMFGNATQQAAIEGFLDTIWAQAGIDVEWLAPNFWNNTTANSGGFTLSDLMSNGASAGVSSSDPVVLNTYFVEITPGDFDRGENSANGLAWIGANGISQAVGDNLVTWPGGQEVVASVVAHEIGHNLGLGHVTESQNLMQSGSSGELLNSSQITTALASNFSLPYSPLPADFNDDGLVNSEDLSNWEDGFGISTGATPTDGDANGDNDVDGSDFLTWQQAFIGLPPILSTISTPVPEPSTLALGSTLLLLTCGRRRKRSLGI